MKFVSSTGYLPVTEKAVELTNDDGSDPEDKMRSLENTTKEMAENFNFLHSGN